MSDSAAPVPSPVVPEPVARARVHAGRRTHARWRRRAALVALAIAAVAGLRATLFAPRPVTVRTAAVSTGSVEETVTNTRAGTLKARRRARLSPETGGRVVALPVREGTRVDEGELLLRLDASVLRAQLDLAREDVRAAAARRDEACLAADLAAKELRRLLELQRGGVASEQVVERATSERERSRAGCRAAEASLGQARARTRLVEAEGAHTELRAPFAGVVAVLATELGEWITPAPPGVPIPPVAEVIDPGSLYVTAPIDEMDAERVRPGQPVRITVDSRRGVHFDGRLVRVAPYVQDALQQNRTIEVEAEFADARLAAELLPGTSADVDVVLQRRPAVLQVPTSALDQRGCVLVLEGGRLVERQVQTGLRNWRTTEVRHGLREGERVVVARDTPEVKAGARAVNGGGES